MPRTCTVCGHSQRPEIDRALVEGTTYRTIADGFGLSETALKRHRKDHIPAHVAQAREVGQVADAGDLLQQLKDLRTRAVGILDAAEQSGDYRTALMGIREARSCIETLMEVEGELDRRSIVNVLVAPQWIEVRAVVLNALRPYPEAAQAVANSLVTSEEGNAS